MIELEQKRLQSVSCVGWNDAEKLFSKYAYTYDYCL